MGHWRSDARAQCRRRAPRPRRMRRLRHARPSAVRGRLDRSRPACCPRAMIRCSAPSRSRHSPTTTTPRPKRWSKAESMSCSSRRRRTFSRSRQRSPGSSGCSRRSEGASPCRLRSRSTRADGCCSVPTSRARSRRSKALRVDVVGLNCSTGPEHMREPVRYLTEHATRPISVIPNAGLPLNTGTGDAVYPLEPAPLATALSRVRARLRRAHCRRLLRHDARASRGGRRRRSARWGTVRTRRPVTVGVRRRVARVSSAMRAITLHQDPPPLLVGERVNAQGSRAVKRLLLADDYDGIVRVAREQAESGAHVLDVCVALTERADEAEQMSRVVKLLSMSVEDAAHDRFDGTGGHRSSAGPPAGPRHRQLDQHGERAQADRRCAPARPPAWRGGRRADDR